MQKSPSKKEDLKSARGEIIE